jgi:hypothetical protein
MSKVVGMNNNQTIRDEGFLEITANSVRLQDEVYQLRNVTGFGLGQIKTKGIPLIYPAALLVIGIISFIIYDSTYDGIYIMVGFLALIIAACIIISNVARPKVHGLFIYLNSGRETVLLTTDKPFLIEVVRTLKGFIENPNPEQVISVKIGRDMQGNITFGNVSNLTVK